MIDDKASKLTRIDERLCCPGCGEFGKVLPLDDGRFLVTCKRDGQPCCQTAPHNTKELAIAAWETLWQEASS